MDLFNFSYKKSVKNKDIKCFGKDKPYRGRLITAKNNETFITNSKRVGSDLFVNFLIRNSSHKIKISSIVDLNNAKTIRKRNI